MAAHAPRELLCVPLPWWLPPSTALTLSDDSVFAPDDFRFLSTDVRFPLSALTMKREPVWRPTV
jgi:hypothetical protein